jgi:hypothetical protein
MQGMKWLSCTVSAGQFRDEFAVSGVTYDGREFSLFTSQRFLRFERAPEGRSEVPAHVLVHVVDARGGLYLVKLPGQTFDNGSTITVRDAQLEDCGERQYA